MKFYYNNQLVRTSKNHEYTHAVIVIDADGKIGCIGCRTSLQAAQAVKQGEINACYRGIDNANEAIKALQAGKEGYYYLDGRKKWYAKFDKDRTVDYYKEWIEGNKRHIKKIEDEWQVVELEAR